MPTIELWAAFGNQLGITLSNYSGYGLNGMYWSSTEDNSILVEGYIIRFNNEKIMGATGKYNVRLVRKF